MKKIAQNRKGQTFLEFMFLLLVIMGLSFLLVKGFGGGISKRWTYLVKLIAKPTDTNISM